MSEDRRRWKLQLKETEQIHPSSAFWFYLHPQWLEDAHPHWWGRIFFSLLIQMLISSGSTLTDTPRNNVLPALWASFSPVKRTHNINSHREPPRVFEKESDMNRPVISKSSLLNQIGWRTETKTAWDQFVKTHQSSQEVTFWTRAVDIKIWEERTKHQSRIERMSLRKWMWHFHFSRLPPQPLHQAPHQPLHTPPPPLEPEWSFYKVNQITSHGPLPLLPTCQPNWSDHFLEVQLLFCLRILPHAVSYIWNPNFFHQVNPNRPSNLSLNVTFSKRLTP